MSQKPKEKRNQLRKLLKIQVEKKSIKMIPQNPNRKGINSQNVETIQIDRRSAFFKRGVWFARGASGMLQQPNRKKIN